MGFKKILSILIFFSVVGLFLCPSSFATDIETKKKQTRAKINHLKWLENVETNKLYKNQQKLEKARNTLTSSKQERDVAEKQLKGVEARLEAATIEYNNMNTILAFHIRCIYKNQRNPMAELILSAEDVNMLFDRIYYRKVLDLQKIHFVKDKIKQLCPKENKVIGLLHMTDLVRQGVV